MNHLKILQVLAVGLNENIANTHNAVLEMLQCSNIAFYLYQRMKTQQSEYCDDP